jgi:hypothetical protein
MPFKLKEDRIRWQRQWHRQYRVRNARRSGALIRRCVMCDLELVSDMALIGHETREHTPPCEPFTYVRGAYVFHCARPSIMVCRGGCTVGIIKTKALTVAGMVTRCRSWLLANAGEQLRFPGFVVSHDR